MANLDNTSKRRSSVQILQPWIVSPHAPSGTVDRAHSAWSYSGIFANSNLNASTTLSLIDLVEAGGIFDRSVVTTLNITDSVVGSPLTGIGTTTLVITDAVDVLLDLNSITDTDLQLQDSVVWRKSITTVAVGHTLYIDDEVLGSIAEQSFAATDTLIISDEVRRVLPTQDASTTLSLTDIVQGSHGLATNLIIVDQVAYVKSKSLVTTLNITDVVIYGSVRSVSLSHTLNIKQSVVGYAASKVDLCNYNPINSNNIFSNSSPTYNKRTTIVLTYPYASPSLTLTLRAPQLENSERDSYNRIIRESRGGTQKIFRSTEWPKNKKLSYQIDYNKNQAVEDFLTFAETSVGKEIGLLDYLDRQWRGILIVSDNLNTHTGRYNRQLSFDFEGVLV